MVFQLSSAVRMRHFIPTGASTSRRPASTLSIASSGFFFTCRPFLRAAHAAAFVRERAVLGLQTRFFPGPRPSLRVPSSSIAERSRTWRSPLGNLSNSRRTVFMRCDSSSASSAGTLFATRPCAKILSICSGRLRRLRSIARFHAIRTSQTRMSRTPGQRSAMFEDANEDVLNDVLGLCAASQD